MSNRDFTITWFYKEWLADAAIGQCSPATRGIWFDLLMAMHDQGATGTITATTEGLARLGRCTPEELENAVLELEISGAASVTRHANVTQLSNRRMVRDAKQRKSWRERQLRHRNPAENNDVTPMSRQSHDSLHLLSSKKTSTSTSDVGADALKFSRIQQDLQRVTNACGQPTSNGDRSLAFKAAALGQIVSEHFLFASLDAVQSAYNRDKPPTKPRYAYLHGVLKSKAQDAGLNLSALLKAIPEPKEDPP